MNMDQVLKQAQKMQSEIGRIQEELAKEKVEGVSGGGMVRVSATGQGEVVSIFIEKEVIDPLEKEVLEDLVLAAIHDAIRKSRELAHSRLGRFGGGNGATRARLEDNLVSISGPIEKIMKLFGKFPGVGDKTARRFALFLLQQPQGFANELTSTISLMRELTFSCSICGNLTTEDPCPICADPFRDRKTLCVIENVEDMLSIEQAGVFSGLYFILGGKVSPLDGEDISPERFAKLRKYTEETGFSELIIATNPSVEGDLTFYAVLDAVKPINIRISRLAFGLPLGGSIGYADRVTLHASLESRVSVWNPVEN